MKKQIQTQITLISLTEKTTVPIQISYVDSKEAIYPASEINLIYKNVSYQGKGTDLLWTDTFADLQVKLPQDVTLACCMTCKHGNMCPFGSEENLLFCTKDVIIRNKSDVCDLFINDDAFGKREVVACGFCDNYVHQTDDFSTYNDYLYRLAEKRTGK